MPPGVILAFGAPTLPVGWLSCNGSAIGRVHYQELFKAIGTTYGVGDHITTFNVPDLRGRTLIGTGQGPTLSDRLLGQSIGAEQHTLSVSEMPTHSHAVNDPGHAHKIGGQQLGVVLTDRNAAYGAQSGQVEDNPPTLSAQTGVSIQATGSSGAHNNMQPSVVTQYIIKY
ncbi:unnamed protein product [Adineta steineri]|uniref:Phage tail collar domain-containing protein n=1 Tax=Adineta steineri TaxID=433720 RepID=A0A815N1T3_9BILA|nr:unnamed protein product [Adineta steineri]CAF4015830.1 unnamed protein product [Adineta steineri]